MNTENTTLPDPSSDHLLSLGERRQLLALGKKLEEMETKRAALMTKARQIIGFETAEATIGIEEELQATWLKCPEAEMVLVEYALATRKRWKLEKAVEDMKRLMGEIGVKLEDLDWDSSAPPWVR